MENQQEILQLETIIKSIQTLVDGGLKLSVITQELNPEDGAKLMGLRGKTGFMVFKESKILVEEMINLPDEVKEFKTDRTPSQQLRGVIYRFWERTNQKESFDTFYKRHIGKLVDQYKDKLD